MNHLILQLFTNEKKDKSALVDILNHKWFKDTWYDYEEEIDACILESLDSNNKEEFIGLFLKYGCSFEIIYRLHKVGKDVWDKSVEEDDDLKHLPLLNKVNNIMNSFRDHKVVIYLRNRGKQRVDLDELILHAVERFMYSNHVFNQLYSYMKDIDDRLLKGVNIIEIMERDKDKNGNRVIKTFYQDAIFKTQEDILLFSQLNLQKFMDTIASREAVLADYKDEEIKQN